MARISIYPPTAKLMQRRLAINETGDKYEMEADHVAEMVTGRRCECGGTCADCQKGKSKPAGLQLKQVAANGLGQKEAPPLVHEVLNSPGRPLDRAARDRMESRFGHDFSQVRVHTDGRAAASAMSVNARAMTVGTDIIFAAGEYAPGTRGGQKLLAHELAHVIQQDFGRQRGTLQRDNPKPDTPKKDPPEKASDKPDPAEVAEKNIEDNWKGVAAVATPFSELKQWVTSGDAVVALIRTHTNAALAAIKAKDYDLSHAYNVVLESDMIMYQFIAWHTVVYSNLLSLRSGIDGLINAFDHDSDVGFGFHYFRAFKGREQADRIARELKKAIDGSPADSKKMLGLIRTDVAIEGAPGAKGAPITATSAAIPQTRSTFTNRIDAMRKLQTNLQRGVDFENQFLDGAFDAGFDQAIDNLEEYYKIKSVLGKGDKQKKPEKKEEQKLDPLPVPLTPVEDEDEKKKKKRPMMRHQIQQGDDKHYASLATTALDDNGVTGKQLRACMAANFQQYKEISEGKRDVPKGWTKGPVNWQQPIRSAIIAQSQDIPAIVKAGGVAVGGDINALRKCFNPGTLKPSNCASNDVRLDVENRGHNLRFD